jgi:hypothetical protein
MKTFSFIAVVILMIISCNKCTKEMTENEIKNDKELIIKYGTIQGWCAGDDSLTISGNDLYYVAYSPCDKNQQTTAHKPITTDEKKELLDALDLEVFNKIELNSCNECVDGSDYWISVENRSYYHKIRYGYADSLALIKISGFVKLLDKQKAKFDK